MASIKVTVLLTVHLLYSGAGDIYVFDCFFWSRQR
jgi:hypothetical protein